MTDQYTVAKETIKGAILIFSCHKHMNTRLKEFGLKKQEYAGWKVFTFIGDPRIAEPYQRNGNMFVLKCEDSYIHILKKVALGMKTILECYDVSEGMLRCGDDLVFDEKTLINFLNSPNKRDYMGRIVYPSKPGLKHIDNFMTHYFYTHPQDLLNPLNGITLSIQEMMQFNEIPLVPFAGGVVVYFSKKACEIVINEMEKVQWNIYFYNKVFGYPYVIEDVGIGFCMKKHSITPINVMFYSDHEIDLNVNHPTIFAYHTNKYK